MADDFELPTNEAGEILPHDHPDLSDERRIIRRISEDYVVDDQNRGSRRLSSAIFKNDPRNGYLSIDSEGCILGLGRAPAEFVTSDRWLGALIIRVVDFRSFDPATQPDQKWKIGMLPLDENECHGGVWGKITRGQSNSLERRSQWLTEIEGVDKLGEQPAP